MRWLQLEQLKRHWDLRAVHGDRRCAKLCRCSESSSSVRANVKLWQFGCQNCWYGSKIVETQRSFLFETFRCVSLPFSDDTDEFLFFFCVHYFDTNPCWSCLTVRPEFRLSGPKSAAWRIEGWLPFSWKSQIPPMMKAGPRWSQTSKIQRHVTMFDCESNRFLFTTTNTHTYMCILYTDMCILYTVYICILTYYVVVSNTIDSETVASNILQGCRGSFGVSALAEIPRRPVLGLVLCQFAKMSAGIHPSIWM